MRGTGGGNNYPLKGGKAGNWEGGIRVNGFVSGGYVPGQMRGTKLGGLVTGWDWYVTFVRSL
jgi:arylsulfatase I/J